MYTANKFESVVIKLFTVLVSLGINLDSTVCVALLIFTFLNLLGPY